MTQPISGACLCGAVSFEIHGTFEHFFLCHCSRCQKGTGSAHAANLFSTSATLTWRTGRDIVKVFRVEGTRHERSFCTECGSPLPCEQTQDGLLAVPAGSLNDQMSLRPAAHIFCADRADWDSDLGALPAWDELPA